MDFTQIKNNLIFKLIGRKYNDELLARVPYIKYMDLAVVFYVKEEEETYLLCHQHLKDWEMTTAEIFKHALTNTQRIFPAIFLTMEEVLSDLTGEDFIPAENVMYVLSNTYKCFGAAALLYENKLQEIADILEDDYYILPSSVHEVIIVPKEKATNKEELSSMVQEVNETQLESRDLLSDHAYFYSRAECAIYC